MKSGTNLALPAWVEEHPEEAKDLVGRIEEMLTLADS